MSSYIYCNIKAYPDNIYADALSTATVEYLNEEVVSKAMTMSGDSYLRHLTSGPIRALVCHDFQFRKNGNTHVAIKYGGSYIDGHEDEVYAEETASKDWRVLSSEDPMCQAIKSRDPVSQKRKYVHNIKRLEQLNEDREYSRFTIGHTIFSVAFHEGQVSPENSSAYMSFLQRGITIYVSRELNYLQGSLYKIIKEELKNGIHSFDSCLKMVLDNTAKILYDYFGFVRVAYNFPAEVRSLFGEELCAQAQYDFLEENVERCDESNLRPLECDGCGEPEHYPQDWHELEGSAGFTLTVVPSMYRDKDMEKAMALKTVLETLSTTLHELFDYRLGMLRAEQDREHTLRRQRAKHAGSIPELIAIVKEDISGYIEKSFLTYAYIDIVADNDIIKSMSDIIPAEQRQNSRVVPILHDGGQEVSLFLPKDATIAIKRIRERFTEYLEDVQDGFKNLFSQRNSLTGLWNQAMLTSILERDIAFVQTNEHVQLIVVWADIYKFKPINELLGHWYADCWLKYNAVRLKQIAEDVARIHGDEHVLVLRAYDETKVTSEAELTYLRSKGYLPQSVCEEKLTELRYFSDNHAVPVYFEDVSDTRNLSPIANIELTALIKNFFINKKVSLLSLLIKDEERLAVLKEAIKTYLENHQTHGFLNRLFHFFIKEKEYILLKAYSREGSNDYRKIIADPERKILKLVHLVHKQLRKKIFDLDSEEFKDFVLQKNKLGAKIKILPQLSLGCVTYNKATIPNYPSDIMREIEDEWAKNKKQ